MKIVCLKRLSALHPTDDLGRDVLSKIQNDDLVVVEIKRPRNIKFHRLYWALVALVHQNLGEDRAERYPSVEDLHAAIKIAVGLRTRIELPDGTAGFIPGSIAFHKMSEDDFRAFYDKVCDLICRWWLPGVTDVELKAEVELMAGARIAA